VNKDEDEDTANDKRTWDCTVVRAAKPLWIDTGQAPRHSRRIVTSEHQLVTMATQPTTRWSRRSSAPDHCVRTIH